MFLPANKIGLARYACTVAALIGALLFAAPVCCAQVLDVSSLALEGLPGAIPRPAAIRLDHGILTVSARDSDLAEILQDVAKATGIAIEGLRHDGHARVFGVYGPGDPGEVIRSLLMGSGYNFILVGGGPDSTPRALLLSPRPAFVALPPHTPGQADEQPEQDSDEGASYAPDPLGPDAGLNHPRPPENTTRTRRIQHIRELHACEANGLQ